MGEWLTPAALLLLRQGFWLTIGLTIVTTVLSFCCGITIGMLRLSDRPLLSRLAYLYIIIHRHIPALVLIIFWAFAFPNLFPLDLRQPIFFQNELIALLRRWTGVPLPYYLLAALLGLTLNTSAYIAELFRVGVGALPRACLEAARTLGAPKRMVYWEVVAPAGIRTAFPAISTRLIHNMKNTALASFVSVPELFHATQASISRSFQAIEFLLLAGVIYLCLSFAMTALLAQIETWLSQPSKRYQWVTDG